MRPLAFGQGEKQLRAEVEPIEDDKSIPELFGEKLPLRCKQLRCGSNPRFSVLRRGLRHTHTHLLLRPTHGDVTVCDERGPLVEDRSFCVFSLEERFLALF